MDKKLDHMVTHRGCDVKDDCTEYILIPWN